MDYNDPREFHNMPEQEQKILKDWIEENLTPFKINSFNPFNTSYGLKHILGSGERGFYVSNGQFKGAMLEMGFEPKDKNETNWVFKLSRKAVTAIRKKREAEERRLKLENSIWCERLYDTLPIEQKKVLDRFVMDFIVPYPSSRFSLSTLEMSTPIYRKLGFDLKPGHIKGAMLAAGLEPKNFNESDWQFRISKKCLAAIRKSERVVSYE